MRNEIGDHAASAGTSSNPDSDTSHTKCRAPAEVRCMVRVIPIATSKMSVAFTSSRIIDMLGPLSDEEIVEKIVDDIGATSRSAARGECCCAAA